MSSREAAPKNETIRKLTAGGLIALGALGLGACASAEKAGATATTEAPSSISTETAVAPEGEVGTPTSETVEPSTPEASPSDTPTVEQASPETATPSPEIKTEPVTEEEIIAAWVNTLTPDQLAVRDALHAKNMTEITPDQIPDIFRIPTDEVRGEDGLIDPQRVIDSFNIRDAAAEMMACSPEVRERYMVPNDGSYEALTLDYRTEAAYGYLENPHSLGDGDILRRCNAMGTLREGYPDENVDPYDFAWISTGIESVPEQSTTSVHVLYTVKMVDTYDTEALYKYTGLEQNRLGREDKRELAGEDRNGYFVLTYSDFR